MRTTKYHIIFFVLLITAGLLAQTVIIEGDSLKSSVMMLEAAAKSSPAAADVHLNLGYHYLAQERWGKAIGAFKKCLNYGKESDLIARAHNGIGLADYGKGEGVFIPIEKIKKLFKIDNYSKAEKSFLKALEIDPDYLDPRYNMGVNFVAKGGEGNYARSVQTLKQVMAVDSLYKEAGLMLGNAYRHLKDYSKAEAAYKNVIATGKHIGKALYRLSEIYLDTGKNAEATEVYYEGIRKITDTKFWDNLYSELNPLMTEWEKKDFRDAPENEKGAFIRKFWKRRDPSPTTPVNERFVEHFRRVQFCLENFPDIIPPYYDDRGKVFVKYGPPDARHVNELANAQIYRNESWTYEKTVRKGLTFDFVQKGHSYRLAHDLSEAAPAGMDMNMKWGIADGLYRSRADFTESYQRFSTGEINNNLIDFHAERSEAIKKAPPEAYAYTLPGEPLPFLYNVAQFRDENQTRLEIYVGVSSSNLKFAFDNGRFVSNVECDFLLRDTTYEDVVRHTRDLKFGSARFEEVENMLMLFQENLLVKPGDYSLTLHMRNQQGKNQGMYTNNLNLRDFSGSSLMLSDIQLATEIIESGVEGEFNKSGFQVTPYPYTVVRKKTPIYVYFEIYNLRFDPAGQTRYKVDYQIRLVEQKRSFLSKTVGAIGRIFSRGKKLGIATSYTQTGAVSSLPQFISLDMSSVPEGIAEFVLTIEDQVSGKSETGRIQFQLFE